MHSRVVKIPPSPLLLLLISIKSSNGLKGIGFHFNVTQVLESVEGRRDTSTIVILALCFKIIITSFTTG